MFSRVFCFRKKAFLINPSLLYFVLNTKTVTNIIIVFDSAHQDLWHLAFTLLSYKLKNNIYENRFRDPKRRNGRA